MNYGFLFVAVLVACILFGAKYAMGKDCSEQERLTCLACNIYHEARGQSETDQMMVGHVTMNRVHSERYPNSVCEVVWYAVPHRQTGKLIPHFTWTLDGASDHVAEDKAWDTAVSIAKLVLLHHDDENFVYVPSDLTEIPDTLMWYHNKAVQPSWAFEEHLVYESDGHIYYEWDQPVALARN